MKRIYFILIGFILFPFALNGNGLDSVQINKIADTIRCIENSNKHPYGVMMVFLIAKAKLKQCLLDLYEI